MRRGVRRWGPAFALVLSGIGAAVIVPSGGAEVASSFTTEGRLVGQERAVAYKLKVDAVAYHLPGKTASGLPCAKGVVAVDPRLIPLGTKLFVPGYGRAVAADVGVGIKGRIIDVWMPNHTAARKWGRKTVVITVYE